VVVLKCCRAACNWQNEHGVNQAVVVVVTATATATAAAVLKKGRICIVFHCRYNSCREE